jgi:hypothetical protein
MQCHPEHVDPAAGHLQHEQHVQPLQEDGVHGEEIHCQYTVDLVRRNCRQVSADRLGAGSTPARWGRSRWCWPRSCPCSQAGTAHRGCDGSPGRVLPGQSHYQRPKLGRHSQTATPVRVAPAASDQVLMPAQQRLGLDQQPVPARARQQPGESGQHGPVGPVHPRAGHLAPKHLDLVAQDERLGVLGPRTPRQQCKPPHCLAEQQVYQSQGHAVIMWPDGLADELAAQHPRSTFWHPQGRGGVVSAGRSRPVPRPQRPHRP